jgi:small-conductance mechanosensitive channel
MDTKKQRLRYWIGIYSLVAFLLIICYYLLDLKFFDGWEEYTPYAKRLILSLFFISIIFLIKKLIDKMIISQVQAEGDLYNLLRITRFLAMVFSLVVIVSFLFQNLYGTALSLGLASLVLGFALQAPITSFIAWVYLIIRRSYLVGDRIQINGLRGDVIDISYLDTSMLECSGDYLVNDRSSGRIIRFPNSLILREEIINYTGPQVPFIWNETAIQIAYTSNLEFVEKCLLEAATEDFKTQYPKVADRNVAKWQPAVYFRINTYAWMEAVISYPVEPEDTTGRRNRILKRVLPMLNAQPDQVQFPEGTNR